MEALPKKAVVAAACVIAAMALLGAYQGWQRSSANDTQTAADGSLLPTTAAVAGAKPASALVETAPSALSEAQVREIARQEVRATLRGDTSSSSESAPGGAAAAASTTPKPATAPPATTPAPTPAAAPPPVSAAAPAPAAQQAAPLF